MAQIENPDSQLTAVKWRFPEVHPEGRKFVFIAGAVTLLLFLFDGWVWDVLAWLFVGLTVWVAAFFRDPVRVAPTDPALVIAPADGLVTMIKQGPPPPELTGEGLLEAGDYTRVSIFMSVFDVHINRAPIAGRIAKIAYVRGKFLNADLDKASEDNERNHILVARDDGVKIGFTQIAGLVARRILTHVEEGDIVDKGERVGLIRFGSRVDVYLPAGTGPNVLLGQRTIAGETVLGRLGSDPALEGRAQ
ncbi:phosphatidylserine decarboxylase [Sphingomicrobium astaxanthinifaciens]|uniref:phosphatidylserine decarboxylase n=1 Tax=Sphingomicrobium astaxanthinifaciens TaxID=1227949 RepID=UPI001FCC2EDA|nr:phosphatidylserine decarboxylase [Sphingomicrobium astaxanthinifaciens]MCJ7420231.1 phosphatidylserine decarboxylase [Sphingomicrobium astaxanthinifaciens]